MGRRGEAGGKDRQAGRLQGDGARRTRRGREEGDGKEGDGEDLRTS